MSNAKSTVAAPDVAADPHEFSVTDVTRTREVKVSQVDRALPAGVIARSIAAELDLPENVPWSLRDDASSAYLDDEEPIPVEAKRLSIVPRSHLG